MNVYRFIYLFYFCLTFIGHAFDRREKEKALRKCNSAVPSPIPSDTEVDPSRPVKTEATTPIKLVAAKIKEPAGNVNGNIVLRVKDGVSSTPDSKFPEKRYVVPSHEFGV